LRRAQSEARAHVPLEDYDAAHGLLKFNPLAEWTTPEVWTYLRANRVPYNALHDRGYPSVGCEPCTRAIRPGEALRAGRWWWEGDVRKECGLHISPVRIVSSATSDVVPVLP
jgi:phosphoadenosine phosphosulfate reductase